MDGLPSSVAGCGRVEMEKVMVIGPAGFMHAPKESKGPWRLVDVLPREFREEYTDTPAWRLKDVDVVRKVDAREIPWPGKHKNVMNWYILASGYAVGWNENPARGWSFPVIKLTDYQWSIWKDGSRLTALA